MSEALQHDLITNATEAAEWNTQATLAYAEGIGPNLQSESIALAKRFGLDEDKVHRGWVRAGIKREARAKLQADESAKVALFKNPAPQPEAEKPAPEQPATEAGSVEEAFVEDDENQPNHIRLRIWRTSEALDFIEPTAEMLEKVGAVLWRLSRNDREVGCAAWVKWLKAHRIPDADARAQWARGFDNAPWCKVEELYEVAQAAGWRYPVAQNLNRLDDMVKRVEGALVRVGADIYQSGGKLVRPVSVLVDATKGRKTRIARLVEIEGAYLKSELSRYVDFFKWEGDDERKPIGAPSDVVSALLTRYGKWEFPTISGIICAPTLRRDGTVLATEGFDPATGLLVRGPLPEMPTISAKPSRSDAVTAIEIVDALFEEFPFVDNASRSVALSGLLSTVCRVALDCVPMHGSTAPDSGTGKSFLLDIIAAVTVGDAMPVIAAGPNLEETGKRLDAQVIQGFTQLSIDNVSIPLGGDELCQAIERPAYIPRILGKSIMKERRNIWTLFASGNNLRFRDDVTRRSLLCRMDANMDYPEKRVFKANPFDTVLNNRGLYLWAAFTVVLAYRAAGMPDKLPLIGVHSRNGRTKSAAHSSGLAMPTRSRQWTPSARTTRRAKLEPKCSKPWPTPTALAQTPVVSPLELWTTPTKAASRPKTRLPSRANPRPAKSSTANPQPPKSKPSKPRSSPTSATTKNFPPSISATSSTPTATVSLTACASAPATTPTRKSTTGTSNPARKMKPKRG
jgi:hypothetical protein